MEAKCLEEEMSLNKVNLSLQILYKESAVSVILVASWLLDSSKISPRIVCFFNFIPVEI